MAFSICPSLFASHEKISPVFLDGITSVVVPNVWISGDVELVKGFAGKSELIVAVDEVRVEVAQISAGARVAVVLGSCDFEMWAGAWALTLFAFLVAARGGAIVELFGGGAIATTILGGDI